MKRRLPYVTRLLVAILVLTVSLVSGCAVPRCEQARMKVVEARDAKYPQVYEAVRKVLDKYFEILYEDPAAGTITTRYSQTKSPEEGILKVRAIALVSDQVQGPVVHVKVVKERFSERWDLWGHNIIEEQEFLGTDLSLEQQVIFEIKEALSETTVSPTPSAVPSAPKSGTLIAPPPPIK